MIISDIEMVKYLEQLTGEPAHLQPLEMDRLARLSLHLRKGYQLYQVKLVEQHMVLAQPKSEIELSPTRVRKVLKAFSTQVQKPVVLVLDQLPAYLRRRYVSQRIPFMIPGQQLFLPQLLIDLQSRGGTRAAERTYFRPATQCMLLYHLLIEPIQGMLQEEVASRLGYSAMTISRAVKECRDKKLISPGSTRIQFVHHNKDLWQHAKSYLRSPIKKVMYAEELEWMETYLRSGVQALAHYTEIAADGRLSIAMSHKQFQHLTDRQIETDENFGRICIEIWHYNPKLLSSTHSVDPLSLYLSLDGAHLDPRTAKSLDQLLDHLT